MQTLVPPPSAIEITCFYTWMGNDGICRTVTKPDASISLIHAKENTEIVSSFYKDRKFPLLIDSRNIRSITREARAHFSTNGRDTHLNSFAIMVQSPLSRVIGNFFLGLNRPNVPARLFDEEQPAIEWLRNFI